MRRGQVYINQTLAGFLTEGDGSYSFQYDEAYLKQTDARPVSLTLPLHASPYQSATMFAFFDGLIPEGWLLDIAEKNWKLHRRDRMGLLLTVCQDCIGNVSIRAEENNE